jgi:hypothetical protein
LKISLPTLSFRLGWAADYRDGYHTKKEGFMKSVQPPHAQIHITFISLHGKMVTESFLREVFEKYGEVKDVSIKKIHLNHVRLYFPISIIFLLSVFF